MRCMHGDMQDPGSRQNQKANSRCPCSSISNIVRAEVIRDATTDLQPPPVYVPIPINRILEAQVSRSNSSAPPSLLITSTQSLKLSSPVSRSKSSTSPGPHRSAASTIPHRVHTTTSSPVSTSPSLPNPHTLQLLHHHRQPTREKKKKRDAPLQSPPGRSSSDPRSRHARPHKRRRGRRHRRQLRPVSRPVQRQLDPLPHERQERRFRRPRRDVYVVRPCPVLAIKPPSPFRAALC